ncbi:hypothetical protein QAD02_014994 [Eretmocerus hayati]|uniref:Uncharacterized protein n=1 Tax=Eretmocerus hayati TaxID=131215 RepID=A0ACC2P7F0_9HYME|nr:hypothetical protein QAD02_014994 [Eretmocerus hayati]
MTGIKRCESNAKAQISYADVSTADRHDKVNSVEREMRGGAESFSLNNLGMEEMEVDEFPDDDVSDGGDEEYLPAGKNEVPQTFDQEELNDFIRKLGLPKDRAEYFALVLKKKNSLEEGTKATSNPVLLIEGCIERMSVNQTLDATNLGRGDL